MDDSLTRIVLATLVVLFILFAALGFYWMTQIGNKDKPDTFVAKCAAEEQAIRRVKSQMKELEVTIKEKKEKIAKVDWEIEVENDQSDRLRLVRSNFQTLQKMRRDWSSSLEKARSDISNYLEGGDYGYQALVRRKDDQERENAQVISKLDSAIDEAKNELTKANNRYTRRYEDKRNLRSRLETELDQAKDELQKASQREPAEMQVNVDAVVLAIDLPSRQVVINIGENQGIKRGMRFEVFRIREGGRRSSKGFIDVRTVDRENSTCMILERDIRLGRCPSCAYTAQFPEEEFCPYCTGSGQGLHVQRLSASPMMTKITMNRNDPMVVGDFVQNPFFHPKASLRFAVKGEPLSTRYKNDRLLSAIRWHGGAIDAEVGAGTDVLLAGKWAIEETRRARELGIEILHHYNVFGFLRK